MRDIDIDKICRVCLESNVDLFLLFDEQNAVDGITLSDMLSECTMYTVRRHDDFPHLICLECKEKLMSAYFFKKQFETSHRTLITFLESVPTVIGLECWNDKCIQTEESTLYPCEKCEEKFLNYERLREHRLVVHKGTANVCRLCYKTFNRIADLKNHMAVFHPEVGHVTPNECPVCKKKFTRKEHVNRHVRTVHKLVSESDDPIGDEMKTDTNVSETLVEAEIDFGNISHSRPDIDLLSNCDVVEYEDNASSPEFAEENPFSSDDDEKPLSALLPNKDNPKDISELLVKLEPNDQSNQIESSFSAGTDEVKQDIIQFDVKRRFKCSECDKSFSRSSHVKRHLILHRQERPYPCTICEKRFNRPDHLKIHLTKHDEDKPFHCDDCDRSYGRSDLLKRHKEQKHGSDKLSRSELCEYCNKSFCSKAYLRKHLRLHTDKNWKCKWCSFEFDSKDALREHTKTHDQEKPFLCSECGLRFVRNDHLMIHMRRHNGEKPYKCRYCGKGFPRATDLNVHERYHTGEKTHLCTTCGKGFQRAYNLVVHMRVHTGERPYKCPHCPRTFAQCNDLKAHIRRHTGERFKCELCGTGFIQVYNLTQHKFHVHGIPTESRIRRVTKVSFNEPMAAPNQ